MSASTTETISRPAAVRMWTTRDVSEFLAVPFQTLEEWGSWDGIGEALGLKTSHARTRAESAFESVAWRADDASADTLGWRCTGCDHSISDRGPYNSHPGGNGLGHAEECPRLTTDIERWQTSQDRGIKDARPASRSMRVEGVRREPDSWAF